MFTTDDVILHKLFDVFYICRTHYMWGVA